MYTKDSVQNLTIGVIRMFQVFYGQLPSCYACSRGHPKELRKETYTVSPLYARKLCTEWVSSLWATLILDLLVCNSTELFLPKDTKISKFDDAIMAIVSVLQEHSPFVFKSYLKQVDFQQKRFIIRKWGFLVFCASVVCSHCRPVGFLHVCGICNSFFFSIKVFHRFNNIERDMKFYLISEN